MLHNKLIRDNRLVFSVLAVSVVVSFFMLIYVTVQIIRWNSFKGKTDEGRKKIETLVNQNPRPGKENEKRINNDAETYAEATRGIVIQNPLQPAVDEFIKVLGAPRIEALTDKEIKKYKEPGTGIAANPKKGIAEVPAKIRKFSQKDFYEFFRNRFEEYCKEERIKKDDRNTLNTLTQFMKKLQSNNKKLFPNWDEAVNAFAREAQKVTFEPVNDATKVMILLSALGFERTAHDDIDKSRAYIDDMSDNIHKYATAKNMTLSADFIGGGNFGKEGSAVYELKEYANLIYHWEVFGDIVKRVADGGVNELSMVILRAKLKKDDRAKEDKVDLRSSFENVGDFRVSHYTVVVTGNMTAIRNAVRNFEKASAENRMYVVRSICLYANEDGAEALMEHQETVQQDNESVQEQNTRKRGRRSRGDDRRAAEQRKRDEEEAQRKKDEESEIHKRSTYGMILVGGDEALCKAYIDIDYIVLNKKN